MLPATLTTDALDAAERRADTLGALRRLSKSQRTVVVLRAWGFSEREIAAMLGVSRRRERVLERQAAAAIHALVGPDATWEGL